MPTPEPGQKLDFDQIYQYAKQNNQQQESNTLTAGEIARMVAKSTKHKPGTKPYRKVYTHVLHKLHREETKKLLRSNDENSKQREEERLARNQKYSTQYRKEILKRKRLGIMTEKDKLFYSRGIERKRKSRKRRKERQR